MTQISEEMRLALSQQPDQPLPVEDPVTHVKYVLVQRDLFEKLQKAVEYDTSDFDPREFYPLFAKATEKDWKAPGMDCYEKDSNSRSS
jgi:hypothetical protein